MSRGAGERARGPVAPPPVPAPGPYNPYGPAEPYDPYYYLSPF